MVEVDISSPDVSGNPVSPTHFVYVISAEDDAVKIGVARNVERRMKELQTGQHRKLSVLSSLFCGSRQEAYAIECRTHQLLKDDMLEGEWFGVTGEEAKVAIEQARVMLDEEKRLKASQSKPVQRYTPPINVNAIYSSPNPLFDAVDIVTSQDGPLEKGYLVNFGDCMIFVGCGNRDLLFVNDVSRWHFREETAA